MALTVEPASREDLEPAFRRFFGDLAPAEGERRVRASLALVESGELDPAGVLVARGPDGLIGAVVCQPMPGATALLWPPRVAACAAKEAVENELVLQACSWLRAAGVRVGHALLAEEERPYEASLLRNGFRHITGLWYLAHDLGMVPETTSRITYHACDTCDPATFGQTLLRTYEGTLDCPEVNHVRTVEEILEGHRAHGNHDPRRWWLARLQGRPVGVLMLTDMPALGGWDVSYLGVVPEARRRGVGRDLTLKAMSEARGAGAPRLTLAVDEWNRPARELYRGLGFQPFSQRQVYLAIWN